MFSCLSNSYPYSPFWRINIPHFFKPGREEQMDSKPRPVEALDKALRLQGVNRSVEESTGSRWVLRLFGSALCEGYHPNGPFICINIYIYMFYFLNMMIFHGCHRYMLACWRYYYISSFLKLGGWYRFENNLSLSLFGDAHWFISQGLVFTLALWVQQGPPQKAHSCKQFQFLAKPSSLGATKGTLAHWEMSSFCRMVPHLWLRWSPLYKDNGLR
jgi:hypothetical protein